MGKARPAEASTGDRQMMANVSNVTNDEYCSVTCHTHSHSLITVRAGASANNPTAITVVKISINQSIRTNLYNAIRRERIRGEYG